MINKKIKNFLIIFFFYVLLPNTVNADQINLQCHYENGQAKIIIEEKKKQIAGGWGGLITKNGTTKFWDYENLGSNIFVHEIVLFKNENESNNYIIRITTDLEKMEEETVTVIIPEADVKKIKFLLPKFERGEIGYGKINSLKKDLFNKWYKDPRNFTEKVTKDWRKDWIGYHPDEYILIEKDNKSSYQWSMIHRCDFIN